MHPVSNSLISIIIFLLTWNVTKKKKMVSSGFMQHRLDFLLPVFTRSK